MKNSNAPRIITGIIFAFYTFWVTFYILIYDLCYAISANDPISFDMLVDNFKYMNVINIIDILAYLTITIFIFAGIKKIFFLIPWSLMLISEIYFIFEYNVDYFEIMLTLAVVTMIPMIPLRKFMKYCFYVPGLIRCTAYFISITYFAADLTEYVDVPDVAGRIFAYIFNLALCAGYILFGLYLVNGENTKVSNNIPAPQFNTLTEENEPTVYITPINSNKVEDELKLYKDMLDKELITEEDYNSKKRQLLGI